MEIKAFIAEFIGTAILLFIGNGVVANVRSKRVEARCSIVI